MGKFVLVHVCVAVVRKYVDYDPLLLHIVLSVLTWALASGLYTVSCGQ